MFNPVLDGEIPHLDPFRGQDCVNASLTTGMADAAWCLKFRTGSHMTGGLRDLLVWKWCVSSQS